MFLALLGEMCGVDQLVFLLDTFAGMPPPSEYDRGRQQGEFAPAPDQVAIIERQSAALGISRRIEICQGLFAETFATMAPRKLKFAFAHIDANIYEGTKEACEFTFPNMSPGAIIVFDDYNGVTDLGARLAIDRCFRQENRRPSALAVTSAFIKVDN